MNTSADAYFKEGCGRCPLGGTLDCKVNNWKQELEILRKIILECGLIEESKWGVPCYTYQNHNILVLSAFKDYASVSFFKGALLNDSQKILSKPGENTQAARLIKFTNTAEVKEMKPILKAYIFEAIEVEKAGLKVEFEKKPEPIPEELQQKLEENPNFKIAFENLTPGRQRGYIIYFSAPKQSNTWYNRIEKFLPKILDGKGMND
ncbi:DUF1801 domain-containing protein [uncultured Algoriphagus sp.]|uniref:YdeI/OmpD-associated family protein n=1 Tax=uncultured Algoriphagus sp. TaxID=417365 RepID=UPI0030EC97FA|tara:strand:+ start:35765 stop:36382 length:618 start_codon:yes stop_codon:yes gene_type:complete